MAMNWIKVRTGLSTSPKVEDLAEILGVEFYHALGLFVRYLSWADEHLVENTTASARSIDRNCHHQGLTKAMEQVGWVEEIDGRYRMVDWEKHNGECAKKRANDAARKQSEYRPKKSSESKRKKSGESAEESATREEKNREELETPCNPPCVSADPKPPREHTNDLALAVIAAVDAYNADQPEAKRLHLPSVDRVAELVQEKLLARGHPYSAVAGVDARDVAMSVEGWREHTATIRAKDPRAATRGKLPKWGIGYLGPALDAKADRVKSEQVKAAEREKTREAAEAKRAEQDAAKARRAEAEAAFSDLNPTARKAMLDKYKRGAEPTYITIMRWYDAEREAVA